MVMKNWMLVGLMVVTTGWAQAHGDARRIAGQLEAMVDSVSREANALGRNESDPREQRKLYEIGDESSDVRGGIQYRIVRELELGTPLDQVAKNFEPIRGQIQYVQRLSQALRLVPRSLAVLISEMETLPRSLYWALNGGQGGGGGQVSAQCEIHTEPNIWTGPKTWVDCRFFGRGLKKYEVLLNVGSTKLEGHLYPELNEQKIATEKVRAGLWPKYEVFVTDNYGRRTLVSKN